MIGLWIVGGLVLLLALAFCGMLAVVAKVKSCSDSVTID